MQTSVSGITGTRSCNRDATSLRLRVGVDVSDTTDRVSDVLDIAAVWPASRHPEPGGADRADTWDQARPG
ncbi:hypothetical protein Rrhod_3589 [Rhodococcus rhodnii LMG 5362]|uniref:Uncharacterized protein n=1 Tax=Rhodococcus rhodnii LMG 5362 TaxID=1273125 RepID=R7WIQ1_9NOCA|nr:hypothetical protein Rrhod_3589 [Rhodococcus rhodnii LMG 5362]